MFPGRDDRAIATRPQLARLGLNQLAEEVGAQRLTLDMTLCGKGTTRPIECVALSPDTDLTLLSPRVIGHEIAATELIMRRYAPGHQWFRAMQIGQGRDTLPDWLLWDVEAQRTTAYVELDLGYTNTRLDAKMTGAVSQSDRPIGYILATTLKGRVSSFLERVETLSAELPQLNWVEVWWLDVESPINRYTANRRAKKVDFASWERTVGARPPGAAGQRN